MITYRKFSGRKWSNYKKYGHIAIKSQRKDHYGIPSLEFNGHVYNDSLGKAKVLND